MQKKANNLVQRISELPEDLPADLFYEQIRQAHLKILDLKKAKKNLEKDEFTANKYEIDELELVERISSTIQRLDTIHAEKQRPILSQLINVIEIHSIKVKIGMYAPNKEALKATGTDDLSLENLNLKEGKLIPFSPNPRRGSSTEKIGAIDRTARRLPVTT